MHTFKVNNLTYSFLNTNENLMIRESLDLDFDFNSFMNGNNDLGIGSIKSQYWLNKIYYNMSRIEHIENKLMLFSYISIMCGFIIKNKNIRHITNIEDNLSLNPNQFNFVNLTFNYEYWLNNNLNSFKLFVLENNIDSSIFINYLNILNIFSEFITYEVNKWNQLTNELNLQTQNNYIINLNYTILDINLITYIHHNISICIHNLKQMISLIFA